jgi:nucleotide-binding universal stress UspA family protein
VDHVTTLRRAILTTDGSTSAHAARDFACALAWPPGATISVATVVELPRPSVVAISQMEAEGFADWRRILRASRFAARDRALQDIDQAAAALRACHPGIDIDEVVSLGEPAPELLTLVAAMESELVIAGARGHTPTDDLPLGGVSEALVTEAPCPALIVRQAPANLHTVVVAIRTPEDADRLADACLALPLPDTTRLIAMTVTPRLPRGDAAAPEELDALLNAWEAGDRAEANAAGQRFVERVRAIAQRRAVEARVVDVTPGSPALNARADAGAAILAEAESLDAALIVVGAREAGNPEVRPGLGSVARKLVRQAPNAVLVVRGAVVGNAGRARLA